MASFRALAKILTELIDGAAPDGAYVLDPEDPGLLRTLDKLSFEDASRIPTSDGASIAAHVDHVRYGLSLLNRWSKGEKPFADADWTASWEKLSVSESEWRQLRLDLGKEAYAWREALGSPREISSEEENGVVGSVVHLGYHFGSIRQMNRALKGPSAVEAARKELNSEQLG